MNTTTSEATTTPKTFTCKSERSAKIAATKLDNAYKAAQALDGPVYESMRAHGVGQDDFATLRANEAKRAEIYAEMKALRDWAKARGWYAVARQLYFAETIQPHMD